MSRIIASLILVAGFLFSCTKDFSSDSLKLGFVSPPDSARPGVYWYFMDGNLDKEGMTKDLESMKKAGIGYVLFLEVNVGVPRGKVNFLSEEWQELYKHAVNEADRLGIRLILGSGPGWAGSGGPWVKPEQSMIHLVSSDTTVSGPADFDAIIPVPKPREPYFGDGSLTPHLKDIRNKWYRDVAMMAFPLPPVTSLIDGIDEKALYYRAPYTSRPGVLPYLPSKASYKELPGSAIDQGRIINLTSSSDSSGRLHWRVPPGRWKIMRSGMRNNGAVTRPAPEPGLGFESDKFDTASFDAHYNAYIGTLLKKINLVKNKRESGWTMIHIDSWEMGAQNWSPGFREEFIKRRNYYPLPYLPVYTGLPVGSREMSERFLWDLRKTSDELITENHAGRFKELGRRNGFRLSIEPYDMNPASDFNLGCVADVPMCEFWSFGFGYNSSFSCIEATSIAHVSGKPVVAAEAFTAESNEAWKKYPGNMKNQSDWAFCMGINRLIYHTFAHKPFTDKYQPGMTMGPYGVHWDRTETWWPMAEAYHKYVTRCQFVLSQGITVADILYLTPEGAPQVFLPPASAVDGNAVMPDKRAYSFDGCSPDFLIKNGSVSNGNIVFPGGASYKVCVLPKTETMTPELLSKIFSLISEGATFIGNPPLKSPSLANYPKCDEQVRDLAGKIWGINPLPKLVALHRCGKGIVLCGESLKTDRSYNSVLKDSLDLYPDYNLVAGLLQAAGTSGDFVSHGKIRYTHKSLSDRDIYFISNRTDSPVSDTCIFRNGSSHSEIWDPLTGEINAARSFSENGRTAVTVYLDSYQSNFIVFYHDAGKKSAFNNINLSSGQDLYPLDGSWNVKFDPYRGGPENVLFENLSDWTKRPEEAIRYYSGIATYSKSFNLPDSTLINGSYDFYLDLGKVKNMARVSLNGHDLGVVWTAPWKVKVNESLKKKGNLLEIEIANLWINRLIGDENEPWDGVKDGKWPDWLIKGEKRNSKRYTFTTHHFYQKGDSLSESGLLGPVKILKFNNISKAQKLRGQ